MKVTALPTIPAELQADHIEATLRNSNELHRQLFAAMGRDGQVRYQAGRDRAYGCEAVRTPSGYRFFGSGY